MVPKTPLLHSTPISSTSRSVREFSELDYEMTGLYPTADSDAVVVEYKPRATLVGGTKYTNSNIAVFRFNEGLIHVYHDYFDPRRFQVLVDALSKPTPV